MPLERVVECAFLIPIRRDGVLSDGKLHSRAARDWLLEELYLRFDGLTVAPGFYEGLYQDPDTGERVADKSRKFCVAIPKSKVIELRRLMTEACVVFQQKCIYLSVAGQVEFIKAPIDDQG